MSEISAEIAVNLTSREKEIFNLLLEGLSPKEIAYKLNISGHTVDFHKTKLYRKLGVQNIRELLTKFSPNGMPLVPYEEKAEKYRFVRLSLIAGIIIFITAWNCKQHKRKSKPSNDRRISL